MEKFLFSTILSTLPLTSTSTVTTRSKIEEKSTELFVSASSSSSSQITNSWQILFPSSSHLSKNYTKNITQGQMADDPNVDPEQVKIVDIVVYTFLFAIAAPANFKIIKCLIWTNNSTKLYRKSRHHFLLLNLAIADAIVLFIMLPTEVGWRVTASWWAGNVGCKIFQFFRVFGLYASSMILICISIDRYYAVVQPFKYGSAAKRISRLLKASWFLSVVLSIPQVIIIQTTKKKNLLLKKYS